MFNEGALAAARNFITAARWHHFLTLGGANGRGKTFIAEAIGRQWISSNYGLVMFRQVEDLLEEMREHYRQQREWEKGNYSGHLRKSPLDWASEVSLLILDDLGAQNETDWAVSKLEWLIGERFSQGKCTIITTNLIFEQLSPRISSRLKGGTIALVEGPDWRQIWAKKRENERK